MYSACGNAALPALGFPIRESTDHRLFSAYPWLIAAVHALHRLLVPRHPPCALHILTVITRSDSASKHAVIPVTLEKLCSFQGPRTSGFRHGHKQEAPAGFAVGLSKLNSMRATHPISGCAAASGPVDIARTCRLMVAAVRSSKAGQALQSWRLP
jgi:hypothetical protein